jgi:hypothetical protein
MVMRQPDNVDIAPCSEVMPSRCCFWLQALARIRATVEEGAYYEAQQQYKSTFHRHKSRKQVQESLQVLQVRLVAKGAPCA